MVNKYLIDTAKAISSTFQAKAARKMSLLIGTWQNLEFVFCSDKQTMTPVHPIKLQGNQK